MKSAQLSWSNRPIRGCRPGVQRQDVRADVGKDAVGGGLVGHVGGDRGDAQPGADGLERIGVAGDDRHPGAVRDQGLDQSQAKATASAGDDSILIFEAHQCYSGVQV